MRIKLFIVIIIFLFQKKKDANFRSTFDYKEKVYFFYSETELTDDTNGLTFKTYVGEVCANDNGRASFSDNTNRFITFKKSLIYCYLPDYKYEYHLKYTEIRKCLIFLKKDFN